MLGLAAIVGGLALRSILRSVKEAEQLPLSANKRVKVDKKQSVEVQAYQKMWTKIEDSIALGLIEEAIVQVKEALAYIEQKRGANNEDYLRDLFTLGWLYEQNEQYAYAVESLESYLQLHKSLLPDKREAYNKWADYTKGLKKHLRYLERKDAFSFSDIRAYKDKRSKKLMGNQLFLAETWKRVNAIRIVKVQPLPLSEQEQLAQMKAFMFGSAKRPTPSFTKLFESQAPKLIRKLGKLIRLKDSQKVEQVEAQPLVWIHIYEDERLLGSLGLLEQGYLRWHAFLGDTPLKNPDALWKWIGQNAAPSKP